MHILTFLFSVNLRCSWHFCPTSFVFKNSNKYTNVLSFSGHYIFGCAFKENSYNVMQKQQLSMNYSSPKLRKKPCENIKREYNSKNYFFGQDSTDTSNI